MMATRPPVASLLEELHSKYVSCQFAIETMCFTCKSIICVRTSSSDVSKLSPPIKRRVSQLRFGVSLLDQVVRLGVVVWLRDVGRLEVVVQQQR